MCREWREWRRGHLSEALRPNVGSVLSNLARSKPCEAGPNPVQSSLVCCCWDPDLSVKRGLWIPGSQTLTRHRSTPWRSSWRILHKACPPPAGGQRRVIMKRKCAFPLQLVSPCPWLNAKVILYLIWVNNQRCPSVELLHLFGSHQISHAHGLPAVLVLPQHRVQSRQQRSDVSLLPVDPVQNLHVTINKPLQTLLAQKRNKCCVGAA